MATSTLATNRASANVSSKRQRYRDVIAASGRESANLVLTLPGLGALAMMTNVQSLLRAFGRSNDSMKIVEPGVTLVVALGSSGAENDNALSD